MFQAFSEKTGVPEGYRNPPGRVMGLMGLSGEERGAASMGRAPPPPLVRIGLGRGRRPPSFLLPLPLPFPLSALPSSPNPTMEGGESYSRWE